MTELYLLVESNHLHEKVSHLFRRHFWFGSSQLWSLGLHYKNRTFILDSRQINWMLWRICNWSITFEQAVVAVHSVHWWRRIRYSSIAQYKFMLHQNPMGFHVHSNVSHLLCFHAICILFVSIRITSHRKTTHAFAIGCEFRNTISRQFQI